MAAKKPALKPVLQPKYHSKNINFNHYLLYISIGNDEVIVGKRVVVSTNFEKSENLKEQNLPTSFIRTNFLSASTIAFQ
ncbi:hypothetical protein KKG83_01950, partial [Candidatus Micrarchaeota archaeon]|nr:hypothetical protein [Candidatus Micrarchaeota archaeon]